MAESCEGPVQLKHALVQIPKCDDPHVKNDPKRLGFRKISGTHGVRYTSGYEKFKNRQKTLKSLLLRKRIIHQNIHTQKCHFPGCHFASSDRDFLFGHYRQRHQGDCRPFKCTYPNCGKSFRRFKGGLAPHRDAHQGHFHHICETCGEKFVKADGLRIHTLRTHTTDPTLFKCSQPQCLRSFFTHESRRTHERNTHAPKQYVCPVDGCSSAFKRPHLLIQHQGRQHKDIYPHFVVTQEAFICEECGNTFKNKNKFKKHMLIHQGVIFPKRFQCPVAGCLYKTNYKQTILLHTKNVHEITERKFICTERNCESKFKQQSSLVAHMKRCHPFPGTRPKCVCHTCGHTLSSEGSLQDHIAIRHLGKRDFVCTKCSREFPTRKYLLRHNKSYPECKRKEPGPNAVYCQLCEKWCSNNNGLKRHMILLHGHENETGKPYKCDICGQTYPIRMYLTRHKKFWKDKNKSCAEKGKRTQESRTTISSSDDASTSATKQEFQPYELAAPVEIFIQQEQTSQPVSMFLTTYQYTYNL